MYNDDNEESLLANDMPTQKQNPRKQLYPKSLQALS
jgi:hypothetical protein